MYKYDKTSLISQGIPTEDQQQTWKVFIFIYMLAETNDRLIIDRRVQFTGVGYIKKKVSNRRSRSYWHY